MKNNRAARAARFLLQFFFILYLYMKTTRTKKAKECFAYFVQSDQPGIKAKHLT